LIFPDSLLKLKTLRTLKDLRILKNKTFNPINRAG